MLERKKLAVKEAGDAEGVSPALVYRWCQERRLKHYRVGSEGRRGKILIDSADLHEFMKQCLVESHGLQDDL